MTNPRDTGRYDAFTDSYIDTNVRIDFAWGNIPMQPNDDRGMAQLDPELDSHIIATTQYEGFPAFITGAPYDDTILNATVPNLVGLTTSGVAGALTSAGITGGYDVADTSTVGATALNDGKVKSQTPAANSLVNYDTSVSVVLYEYVAPATTGPIAGFNRLPVHFSLNSNQSNMFVVGRTVKPTVGDTISVTGSSDSEHNTTWTVLEVVNDDSYNTGGTAIKVSGNAPSSATSTGGTWTKV